MIFCRVVQHAARVVTWPMASSPQWLFLMLLPSFTLCFEHCCPTHLVMVALQLLDRCWMSFFSTHEEQSSS